MLLSRLGVKRYVGGVLEVGRGQLGYTPFEMKEIFKESQYMILKSREPFLSAISRN